MTSIKIGNLGEISKALTRGIKKEKEEVQERLEEKLKQISCVITPFLSDPEENLHIFLRFNNIKYKISEEMTILWPYGRVIETSAGYSGEFRTFSDESMSLMYLGKEIDDAIKIMSRIVDKDIEIENKKKKQK
jgi:hypothetical protein